MAKYKIFTVFYFLFTTVGFSQDVGQFVSQADSFLKSNVTDGKVNYKTIKENTASLDALLDMAAKMKVSKEGVNSYQAFWINAYNLAVIKGVVDHYPIKSPLDVDGFFDTITYSLGNQEITLNDLENKLLRANFPLEPRFHFVLVCAGLGCPPITNFAYEPSILDSQLTAQTYKAINDPKFIRVERDVIKISQIFEWYKGDFEKNDTVVDFINKYRAQKLPLESTYSYYPYDWTLNGIK